jgi:hypothetical protein
MFDSVNLDLDATRARPRVAYLVSGHFRNFDAIEDAWTRFRERYPHFDVYVHAWDDLGTRSTNAWIDLSTSGRLRVDEIERVVRPTAMVVQPMSGMMPEFSKLRALQIDLYYVWFQNLENMTLDAGTDFPSCIMSQLYSIYAAWKLMSESGKTYDVVVRMRADCKPAVPAACLWMPFCEARLFDNVLFFNGSDKHVHPKGGRGCLACDAEAARRDRPGDAFSNMAKQHAHHENDVCDIFYYGNPAAMARISQLYFRVPELVEDFHAANAIELEKNKNLSDHVKHLAALNIYGVKNATVYADHIKCFYPERLIREALPDMWLLSDPSKVEPWK